MDKYITIKPVIKKVVRGVPGPAGDPTNPSAYFRLDTSSGDPDPTYQGQFWWDQLEETISLRQNGTILQIGQETQWMVRNTTGTQINNGSLVMATGAVGASGRITVGLFDGSDESNAKYILGMATEDIAGNNGEGKVTNFGKVRDIDTTGQGGETWSDGDVLWASTTTPGALTNIEPTNGSLILPIAFVVKANATSGVLAVRVTPIDENNFNIFIKTETKVISSPTYNLTVENRKNYLLLNVGGDRIINLDITSVPIFGVFGITIGAQNSIGSKIRIQTITAVGSETYLYMGEGASALFIKLTGDWIVPFASTEGEQFSNALRFSSNPSDTNPVQTRSAVDPFTYPYQGVKSKSATVDLTGGGGTVILTSAYNDYNVLTDGTGTITFDKDSSLDSLTDNLKIVISVIATGTPIFAYSAGLTALVDNNSDFTDGSGVVAGGKYVLDLSGSLVIWHISKEF